jgi:hypothetical protein
VFHSSGLLTSAPNRPRSTHSPKSITRGVQLGAMSVASARAASGSRERREQYVQLAATACTAQTLGTTGACCSLWQL